MTAAITELRPAVISRSTRDCLDEYRAFRHLVRNIYTFNLRPARLAELADGVDDCLRRVKDDLNGFITFLQSVALAD